MKLNHIRAVICAFRDSLPEMFPNKTDVAKTIVFVKDKSNADDIIRIVLEEFAEGNDFCQKIVYRATEDFKTKTILADFCTLFNPRIVVVTVE
jgi:type I restriction enzyme, R subunit